MGKQFQTVSDWDCTVMERVPIERAIDGKIFEFLMVMTGSVVINRVFVNGSCAERVC